MAHSSSENVPAWLRTSAGWSWRLIALTAAVALVFWATAQVQLVFVAVFLGLVFASVLSPVADVYSKVMPRPLATALAILSAFLVLGGMLTYVVASVAGQWEQLAGQFDTGLQQIVDYLESGPFGLTVTLDQINEWIDQGRRWVGENADALVGQAAQGAGSVAEGFAILALSIFCTVFFVASGAKMWHWFLDQLPERYRGRWDVAAGAGWYSFSGYARGTVIIAFIDGVLSFVLLTILGVPLAAPLAVLVFIGAFIPLIGAPLAMIIAAVVALAANGIVTALIVTVGIALIGQLEGHVLQPWIMGRQVALHPVVIGVGVTTGTVLAGILGAIIAVPLMAVAWTVFSTLRGDRPHPELEELTARLGPGDSAPPDGPDGPDDPDGAGRDAEQRA
ncbi:AI-2E family transporter [Isoptericola cucumis]|uniref:AI-2E family transporter n=1 Tax=Isoptericola cucumis TaxID=1776856 RepID=A0ABQ2B7A3_9MICO|nr:AI-2E family transporter [Isoptericola cucumis]GGI06906.1 AI-2E family transporter [Isoptericola cucumis]